MQRLRKKLGPLRDYDPNEDLRREGSISARNLHIRQVARRTHRHAEPNAKAPHLTV